MVNMLISFQYKCHFIKHIDFLLIVQFFKEFALFSLKANKRIKKDELKKIELLFER